MAGISRSATLVIAYLMKYHQLPLQQAFSLITRRRDKVNFMALRSILTQALSGNYRDSSKSFRAPQAIWEGGRVTIVKIAIHQVITLNFLATSN